MPASRVLVPLRWSDLDAYGHINNVAYLRILEEARITGFRSWFGGEPGVVEAGVIVARHEIEYLTPLSRVAVPVAVDMWAVGIRTSGFGVGYEIRDPDEKGTTVYARAETWLVAYDLAAGRPRPLTGRERAVLAPRVGEPVAMRGRR